MISTSDTQVLSKLLRKDEEAFRLFYLDTKEHFYKYLLKFIGEEDAEEVLHDTYIAFIEGLRNFRGQSSLKTYLYSIGKRKAVDKLRRQKVKKILFSYLPDHIVDSIAKVFLKDDIDKKFLAHRIEKSLKRLPHDYAVILRLKYNDGYSVAEIATKTNQTIKATESMLYRARQAFIKSYTHHERQTIQSVEEALQ